MNSPDLIEALQALATDKGISVDTLFGALADAFEDSVTDRMAIPAPVVTSSRGSRGT